jgi:hypothetical protein
MATGNSMTNYVKQPRAEKYRFFFTGEVALERGVGLCFDYDYGTATDAEGRRDKFVELPSATNNKHFAGVTAAAYPAKVGGRWIELYVPGSKCLVAAGQQDTVVGTTIMTCVAGGADAGRFGLAGYLGRGTARALQTKTVCAAVDLTGAASVSTKTVTSTGKLGSVLAGDKMVILGGTAGTPTPGVYTIASVTSADELVLDETPGDGNIAYYIIRNNPLVLAELLDGEESGLQQAIAPVSGDAVASMVGGTTFILGGYTIAADSTFTLADETQVGAKKAFKCLGALTTSDYIVTVNGLQEDGATALVTASFDAADEVAYLTWYGDWFLDAHVGAALASS